MVNNKDNRVLMSRNYRSDSCPWKFDVLKTGIFALEASLLGQIWINYRLIVAPQKFDVLKTNICPRSEASRANMLVKNIKFPRGNYQTDISET